MNFVATTGSSRRAIERYGASLKQDEGDKESMVGLARTHLRRSAVGLCTNAFP